MHPCNLQALSASNEKSCVPEVMLERPDAYPGTHSESTDVVGLKKQLEEASLAGQKYVEERDQLIVQVETLQRQLAEVIEAKVGLEKEKKLLLAGGAADASQCSTPRGAHPGCSTPPQSSLKRTSRSFTSAHLEEWEKLQLRIQKAERALEHERMVTSELQRLVDSHRAAALFGKTARASFDNLMGELAAVQQKCAQQQQQADALRAAMNASDHTTLQLRQELADLMQTKQASRTDEDSIKKKQEEAEAADEQCVALAALVDQLVQENLELGAKLNAKSAALTKARSEISQMQAKVLGLEAAAAPQQSSASSNERGAHDPNTHTAITISDLSAGTGPRALESGLPGGLSDTQWQLLMLSEEVARLTQQLADLQGPITKAPTVQGQAHAQSTSRNCDGTGEGSTADAHSCVQAPTSTVTAGAAALQPAIEDVGGGMGEASTRDLSVKGGVVMNSEGMDKTEGTATSTHPEPAEDGVSGSRSRRAWAGVGSGEDDLNSDSFIRSDEGAKSPWQPSLKHPVVELHLPPARMQQRVSELAATMMELEEQVEAELSKQKQREQLQEGRQTLVPAKDLQGVCTTAAATQRPEAPAPGSRSKPCLLQPPYQDSEHSVPDTQQQEQQQHQQLARPHSQSSLCLHPPLSSSHDKQPAVPPPPHLQQQHHQQPHQQQSQFQTQPAHTHLPVPSNLWERRLSRSLSMASLSGRSSGSPPLDSSANSHAVQVLLPPNGLSVEVGEGGGELDPADPPFVQQIDHHMHHCQPSYSFEDGLLLSDNEEDDEEMLKNGRGAKPSSSTTRKGGWGLWSWLAGGG